MADDIFNPSQPAKHARAGDGSIVEKKWAIYSAFTALSASAAV
jgi:hypothetical protein